MRTFEADPPGGPEILPASDFMLVRQPPAGLHNPLRIGGETPSVTLGGVFPWTVALF
jgi:hypothetical protein